MCDYYCDMWDDGGGGRGCRMWKEIEELSMSISCVYAPVDYFECVIVLCVVKSRVNYPRAFGMLMGYKTFSTNFLAELDSPYIIIVVCVS